MRVLAPERLLAPPRTKDDTALEVRSGQTLAAICFLGGSLFGILGLILGLLPAIGILTNEVIGGGIESGLLVIALVLLIAGAQSLDRIRSIEKDLKARELRSRLRTLHPDAVE